MTLNTEADFFKLSGVLIRRCWLMLVAAALLGGAVLYLVQLSTPLKYQARTVLSLNDWQTERLTRRDDPTDKNPANVGGASADEMSRALVRLKDPAFFQSLPFSAVAEQLSFEHKRRGNMVTLNWTSSSAERAEQELTQLVKHWDQLWQQDFIQQHQQLRQQLGTVIPSQLQQQELSRIDYELQQASVAQPFALKLLRKVEADGQPKQPALWQVTLWGSLLGFVVAFVVLMLLWRR